MTRVAYSVMLIFFVCMLASCGDYSINLPNGYSLTKISGETRVISDDKNMIITNHVVDGTVSLYAVCGVYVTGTLSMLKNGVPDIQKTQYFLINTQTGFIKHNLDEQTWKSELVKIGVIDVKLRRPSKYDLRNGINNQCTIAH